MWTLNVQFLSFSCDSREDNFLKSTRLKLQIGNRPVSIYVIKFFLFYPSFTEYKSEQKWWQWCKTTSRSKWKFFSDKDILERNHHPSIFLEFMWKIGRLRLYVLQWRCFIFKRLDSTLSLSQIHQGWHQILNGSRFSKGFVSYTASTTFPSHGGIATACTKSISFRLFRFYFFLNSVTNF